MSQWKQHVQATSHQLHIPHGRNLHIQSCCAPAAYVFFPSVRMGCFGCFGFLEGHQIAVAYRFMKMFGLLAEEWSRWGGKINILG